MISPDAIPVWFAIPFAVAAMVAWLVVEYRISPMDENPDPEDPFND